jgi:ceramide glucosyltransferase
MMENCVTAIYWLLVSVLTIGAVSGLAYFSIAIYWARRFRQEWDAASYRQPHPLPPISLLKPLCGAELQLKECLESFFVQDYPEYEILFAVRHGNDPAVDVVRHLERCYPQIPVRMIYTGEPPYANAKVYSLERMAEAAQHDLLVITDSDTSVEPDYLKAIARDFALSNLGEVGMVTNLYRGVGGRDIWSRLEALGMSTEFMAGVIVANGLEGMKFTLGPSMAIRRSCLDAIGGFAAMKDYLADDFVLGNWTHAAGWRVALSTHVVNHHVSTEGFRRTFEHRVRWNRSTRFSRPAGYIGQGFTYGLCWAFLLFLVSQSFWAGGLLLMSALFRYQLAVELANRVLHDRIGLYRYLLLPIQDLLSFTSWLQGFLGREVVWRNERYRLLEGGRFEPIEDRVNNAVATQGQELIESASRTVTSEAPETDPL